MREYGISSLYAECDAKLLTPCMLGSQLDANFASLGSFFTRLLKDLPLSKGSTVNGVLADYL